MRTFIAMFILLVLATESSATVRTEAVTYKQGDAILEGHLAWDDAVKGKRPGVLVVHEWWGRNGYADRRAEQLAALGYVAFAVDMYGKGIVTEDAAKAGEDQQGA